MKRLKKILKWMGIVLGALIAILLIANAWFVWTTDAQLEKQLAAIRAAGDPLTLAELKPKPIPPEKNAATYLRQAEPDVTAIENEIERWIDAEKQPELRWYLEEKQPMPEKMRKAMNAIYAAHPKVIELLQQAADCPDYDAQLNYSLPAEQFMSQTNLIMQLRGDARVLMYRSRLLEIDGNYDEAVRMSLTLFRLSRHFDRNPMLVNHLVALTVRGMAVAAANLAFQSGSVSKETRQALDAELAIQERTDGFAWALKSERAFLLDLFPTRVPARNFWLGRGIWNMQESACLELFPMLIAKASASNTYRDFERMTDGKQSGFASLLLPGLKASYQVTVRTRAMIRCLRVVNALQTHVAAGSDKIPKLTELGLPTETTTDPFTGEPLHVKKLPQGWLVYSVGSNFQDDGGKIRDFRDVGIGPPIPTAKPAKPAKK